MAMTINTNNVSINAQRNLSLSGSSLSTTMQRLSSGLRVNSAKDDAAGLAIAERMNAQAKGLAVAARNANDGISLAQTAEGALGKMGDMLQRMRELAVQASNATNSTADREALQSEVNQLRSEIDRVAKTTTFNGQKILDGSFSGGVFQVGAGAGDNITVGNITNAKASNLGAADYGAKELKFATASMTDLTAIAAGKLSLKIGDETVELGGIAKANSAQERAGQLVAAINAKTADTGVTAFLTEAKPGELAIQLRSSNVEAVTEVDPDTNVSTTSIKAVAVTLSGFTNEQTGMESVELNPDLAPNDGLGYEAFAARVAAAIQNSRIAGTSAVDVSALTGLTATSTMGDATAALQTAITNLNTANNTAYSAVATSAATGTNPAIPGHGLTGWTLTRNATTGNVSISGAAPGTSPSTAGDALQGLYAKLVPTGTPAVYASSAYIGGSAADALNIVVDAIKNFEGDLPSSLTTAEQTFVAWVKAAPPKQFAASDFEKADPKDAVFALADFSFTALMGDVASKSNQTTLTTAELAKEVFGEEAANFLDSATNPTTWKTGLSVTQAKAAFAAAQEYVTKQGALGITQDNVENDVGMEEMTVTTQAGAWSALKTIDSAIDQVNSARADLGALQTRFEKSIENIDIQSENIVAARGRIVDADFANETAALSRAQILQQAGTAMVAQANQLPQNVLSLLR